MTYDSKSLLDFLAENYRASVSRAPMDTRGIVDAMKASADFKREVDVALARFNAVAQRCSISKTHADFLRRAMEDANA